MRRFNPALCLGVTIVGLLVIVALTSFVYTPYDPNLVEISGRHESPSFKHPFGTDRYGRDILSRCMVGARVVLAVGLLSVSIGFVIGVLIGSTAGYYGGWVDSFLMRVMDGLYAFPALLFAIMIVAVLGTGIYKTIIAIGIANIPVFARLARAGFLSEKEKYYVKAAQALGSSDIRIMVRHILPNIMPTLLVQLSTSFAVAILAEAGLSYLGLGSKPPHASWGRMLKEARIYLGSAPWASVFPGLAIIMAVLGFNMLGDGLRDAFDPKLRKI